MKVNFPLDPASSEITASLRRDHEIIKKVLKATETVIVMLKEGKTIPSPILADTVDFITNFIDRCHHQKEEKGLFTSLEEAGLPRDIGPIAVMLREHEPARILAESIKESVKRFIEVGDENSRASLIKHCEDYVQLMTTHLLKEDTRLFVIAEMQLKGKVEVVGSIIQKIEAETMGSDIESYRRKAQSILAACEKKA